MGAKVRFICSMLGRVMKPVRSFTPVVQTSGKLNHGNFHKSEQYYIAENNNWNRKKAKKKKSFSIKSVLDSCVFKALKYVVYRNAFDSFPSWLINTNNIILPLETIFLFFCTSFWEWGLPYYVNWSMNYRHVLSPFIRSAPVFCFAPAPIGCDGEVL